MASVDPVETAMLVKAGGTLSDTLVRVQRGMDALDVKLDRLGYSHGAAVTR